MQMRPFEAKDQYSVVKLWQECNLIVPWNDPYKDIQRKLKVDPDLFIVGETAGEVIATVMGGYEGHRGWINYLAVSPAHQRKGYGRQLMEFVEVLIKQKGSPKINIQVRQANTDVIKFYEAIGYKNDNVVSLGKRLESDN
ncbi:GNAT family acetyltransferase [Methylobacter sp. YRD-M1]|uniref:GNAT family acetyltransferase n=1 Tax=Methylobacter sp. YRD-M1 TaxID=2911520 RepID=UPI00227ACBF3|nr:GNAT family acetyltransferase [Methylobacter sp. YRD-M1]WAK01542.1 GNAT family acetyltransferase [Methylobacter sp. YRD-M1]